MAGDKRVTIVVDAKDNASATLKGIQDKVTGLRPAFAAVAAAATAAFVGIAGVVASSVKEAAAAQKVNAQLSAGLANVAKMTITASEATKKGVGLEQLRSEAVSKGVEELSKMAGELQKVTKYSDDEIKSAQAMLSTFQLNSDQIGVLTPRLADMAAGLEKVTGQQVDLQTIAIAVGKAVTLGAGALTRYGVVLSDTQAKQLETATGLERINLIAEILDGNFEGLAKAIGDTFEGKLAIARNVVGELQETIGNAFLPVLTDLLVTITPIIEKMTAWIEKHPETTKQIIIVAGAVTGLVAALSALGLVIPAVAGGIALLASPVGLVVGVVTALMIAVGFLIKKLDELRAKASQQRRNEALSAEGKPEGFIGPLISEAKANPTIPKFAEGGIVTRPTLALVGEGGEPEIITPLSKAGGVTFDFRGATISDRDAFIRQILSVLDRRNRLVDLGVSQ